MATMRSMTFMLKEFTVAGPLHVPEVEPLPAQSCRHELLVRACPAAIGGLIRLLQASPAVSDQSVWWPAFLENRHCRRHQAFAIARARRLAVALNGPHCGGGRARAGCVCRSCRHLLFPRDRARSLHPRGRRASAPRRAAGTLPSSAAAGSSPRPLGVYSRSRMARLLGFSSEK